MTTNKPPRLFAVILLSALLFSLPLSVFAKPRLASAPAVTAQEPDIHTIAAAGLQYELPKGWKTETQENGNIFLTFEDGAGTVTFIVEDNYADIVSGMKSGLKEKLTDMKSDGPSKEDTHNGMTHISESGTGLMKEVKIAWSIDVLKATRNVTLLTFGVSEIMQKHIGEYEQFVGSIKKK